MYTSGHRCNRMKGEGGGGWWGAVVAGLDLSMENGTTKLTCKSEWFEKDAPRLCHERQMERVNGTHKTFRLIQSSSHIHIIYYNYGIFYNPGSCALSLSIHDSIYIIHIIVRTFLQQVGLGNGSGRLLGSKEKKKKKNDKRCIATCIYLLFKRGK